MFNKRVLGVSALAVVAAAGTVAQAAPRNAVPQQSQMGREMVPSHVQSFTTVNGRVVLTSPQLPYQVDAGRATHLPVFDAAEILPLTVAPGTPAPIGGIECGLGGASSRWFFGTGAFNVFTVNDFTVSAGNGGKQISRLAFAWYWNPPTPEVMRVAIAVQDGFDATCTDTRGPAFGAGSGVIFSFDGNTATTDIDPTPGNGTNGYFFATPTIGTLAFTIPADGDGAYIMRLAQNIPGTDGVWQYATRSQFMLWGTGDGETPNDGRPGTQGPRQWDDDNPQNGVFTPGLNPPVTTGECYDYNFNLCPNPLANMLTICVKGVINNAPVVVITSPTDGQSFPPNTNINFSGIATDDECGLISSFLDWSSSLNGVLATDTDAFSRNSGTLNAGNHVITASVEDFGSPCGTPGNPGPSPQIGSATINITIEGAGCFADCDNNGVIDINDFFCFLALYAANDSRADCNGDTTIDINDFFCFLARYAQNC